ncbi:hypothetical protein H0G86_006148 [Trichoderma simmonsii]|uniref:Uncharacterized protein n=1 Tax=Trichoderma simmonsii TaxID=1491479 RepID=A0A8G0LCZ1_9HYPO|nr:hypothetical protein H0G86_006148 [Trichoderma simmonsii]
MNLANMEARSSSADEKNSGSQALGYRLSTLHNKPAYQGLAEDRRLVVASSRRASVAVLNTECYRYQVLESALRVSLNWGTQSK